MLLQLPVDTVYVGGGTPTLAGIDGVEIIVRALRRRFRFGEIPEFTTEVTPGSADQECLRRMRALGINRLSIGAQSFADAELRSVGRLHGAIDTVELVRKARSAGFSNISLDLIAGLPHQCRESWTASLDRVLELRPEHISVYLFEVDEKSRLGSEVLRQGTHYHAPSVPDEDFMSAAYEEAQRRLAYAGYVQYEISNFALPGLESRHNQRYWQLKPYLGLGAGAHSFSGTARWANVTEPAEYQAAIDAGRSPAIEQQTLSLEDQMEEFFFLGLRQRSGVDLDLAAKRWGRDCLVPWGPRIASLEAAGLLERADNWIRVPETAYLVSNEVFQQFLL
jgi:oxygen-independent coproporphyrinogen-3 oxidase